MVARLQSKGSQDQAEEASTGSTQLDVSGGTGGLDSTGGGAGGRAAGAAGTLVGYRGMVVSERFFNPCILGVRTVAGRASLGRGATSGSSARRGRVGGLGNGTGGREEVRAVALLLTVGVLLGVGGRASALGAGSDTAIGVVGLVVAGAGDVVALSNTADVGGLACSEDALDIDPDYGIEIGL